MKRLILSILAFLLLAAPALAFDGACQDGEPWQLARMSPAILGAGSGVAPTGFCVSGTSSATTSAVFCEDFESDQVCESGVTGQSVCRTENHFVTSSNCSAEPTYNSPGLAGSTYGALFAEGANGGACSKKIDETSRDTSYLYAVIKIATLSAIDAPGEEQAIVNFGTRCKLHVGWDGDSIQFGVYDGTDTIWGTTAGFPTVGTEYHVWLEFVKNTSCVVYVSTNSTKPGAPEASNGAPDFASASASLLVYDFGYDIDGITFDNILFSTSAIPSQ